MANSDGKHLFINLPVDFCEPATVDSLRGVAKVEGAGKSRIHEGGTASTVTLVGF